jgi:hypothetical protein
MARVFVLHGHSRGHSIYFVLDWHGGSLWAIPNTSVPMIVPPAVVFVGLIVAARRI